MVCTKNMECMFGKIVNAPRRGTKSCARNDTGKIAHKCWKEIPKQNEFKIPIRKGFKILISYEIYFKKRLKNRSKN